MVNNHWLTFGFGFIWHLHIYGTQIGRMFHIWLVVWNIFFHSVGNVKIPIDELHHFAEGVGSTSNQLTVCKLENDPFVDDVPIKMVSFHMFPNDFMDFPQ